MNVSSQRSGASSPVGVAYVWKFDTEVTGPTCT